MDQCWWCVWFHDCICLKDAPKRVPVSPDGWCEGFAGVWDGFFDQRERKYLTFQSHEN